MIGYDALATQEKVTGESSTLKMVFPIFLEVLNAGFMFFLTKVINDKKKLNDATLAPALMFLIFFSRGFTQVRAKIVDCATLPPGR